MSSNTSALISKSDLNVEDYDEIEREQYKNFPNRVLEAFQCVHFSKQGYPIRICDKSELWRYHDAMQEGRFESNLKLLGRLTYNEFDQLQKITNQVSSFSGLSGRNVVTRSLIAKRAIDYLCKKGGTIFEIGPGCGYLGAMLLNDGYHYIGYEIAQAFYLYQNQFWRSCFGDRVKEMLWGDAENYFSNSIESLAIHMPWWTWVESGHKLPQIDLVVCNSVLSEMSKAARLFTFGTIKKIFCKQGSGLIVLESLGSQKQFSHRSALDDLFSLGFEVVHTPSVFNDNVTIMSVKGNYPIETTYMWKQLIPTNIAQGYRILKKLIRGTYPFYTLMKISTGFDYQCDGQVSSDEIRQYYRENFIENSMNPKDEKYFALMSRPQ